MLSSPPRDNHNKVIPHDHSGISPEDWVIRRISPDWIVDDPKVVEGKRLSSQTWEASGDENGGMSVDLLAQIKESEYDPASFVTSPRWPYSIKMLVLSLRQLDYKVGYDPILDEDPLQNNPFHGQVWGSFSKGKQNALSKISEWFVQSPNVSITKA